MYKITFRLAAPCVFIDRPIFDSILAYALWREQEPNAPQKLSYTEKETAVFNAMLRDRLPLRWHEDGYPLASLLFFEERREQIDVKRKKWDAAHDDYADFGKQKRQIRVNAGAYKSYEIPRVANIFASPHGTLPFSPFGHVWFYFVSDDVARVRYLLDNFIAGIGKDIGTGKGRWSEYVIEERPEPFVAEKMRPVPMRFLGNREQANVRLRTWKPPYWDGRGAELCLIPHVEQ